MASLQVTFGSIRAEVQRYMGFGRNTGFSSLSPDSQGDVLSVIDRGLRQFYSPMPLPGESSGHEWTFLTGEGVVSTSAPYTTGTVTVAGAVVTGDGTTFAASMVGKLFHCNNEIREVSVFTDTTHITLDRAVETNVTSAATYEILGHKYDMPSDFGGMKGTFAFRDGDGYSPVNLTNWSNVQTMRSQSSIRKDIPEFAAIIPKDTDNDSTTAQTSQVILWPFPDKIYDLNFVYTVFVESISDDATNDADDNNVPIGGMMHGETIIASCLAVAEQMIDEFNNPGKNQARFIERLAASISYDRRNMLPDGFGYNADNSDRQSQFPSRRRIQVVTRNNVTYP
jgi:hypothetical protein